MAKQLTLVCGLPKSGKTSFIGVLTALNNLNTAEMYADLHKTNIKKAYKQIFDSEKDFVFECHSVGDEKDDLVLNAIEKGYVINTYYISTDTAAKNIFRLEKCNADFAVDEIQGMYRSQDRLLFWLKEISNRIIFFDNTEVFRKIGVYSDNTFSFDDFAKSNWLDDVAKTVFNAERHIEKPFCELTFLKYD